jgi:hypothetical protein
MLLNTRCNYAGSLGKTIPTRSFPSLLARLLPASLLRILK